MSAGPIHLHAGPHKTATTHIQVVLDANRKALAQRGITVTTLEPAKEWLQLLRSMDAGPLLTRHRAARRARRVVPRRGLWLMSSEHFLASTPFGLLERGTLLPHLPRQVQKVRRLFPQRQTRVFLALRSYDELIRSSYLEVIRNRGFRPFDSYRDLERAARLDWFDAIRRLAETVGPENITLWRYEEFRQHQDLVLGALCATEDVSWLTAPANRRTTRPSLTSEAIGAMQRPGNPEVGTDAWFHLMFELSETFSTQKGYERFDPWNDHERSRLRQRYARDVNAIRSTFPTITFLGA